MDLSNSQSLLRDRHTDRQTLRQTDTETDTQTETERKTKSSFDCFVAFKKVKLMVTGKQRERTTYSQGKED